MLLQLGNLIFFNNSLNTAYKYISYKLGRAIIAKIRAWDNIESIMEVLTDSDSMVDHSGHVRFSPASWVITSSD